MTTAADLRKVYKNKNGCIKNMQYLLKKGLHNLKLPTSKLLNPPIIKNLGLAMHTYVYAREIDKLNYWDWGLYTICREGYSVDFAKYMIINGAIAMDLGLEGACESDNSELIEFMFTKCLTNGFHSTYLDRALVGACKRGDLKFIKRLIERGAEEFACGLEAACEKGNIDVVKMLMKLDSQNWNGGLCAACRGGHLELVKYFLTIYDASVIRWKLCFNAACSGGNVNVVKFLISKGDLKLELYDRNHYAMSIACQYGHLKLFKYLKWLAKLVWENSTCSDNNWNSYAKIACDAGNMQMFRFLIKSCNDIQTIPSYLFYACRNGSIELINYILELTYKLADELLKTTGTLPLALLLPGIIKEGFLGACEWGDISLMYMLTSISHNWDMWNDGLLSACRGNNVETVKKMLKLVSFGKNIINDCMRFASIKGYTEIIKLLISHGGDQFDKCLYLSTENKHYDITKLMVKHGATNTFELIYSKDYILHLVFYLKHINSKPNFIGINIKTFSQTYQLLWNYPVYVVLQGSKAKNKSTKVKKCGSGVVNHLNHLTRIPTDLIRILHGFFCSTIV